MTTSCIHIRAVDQANDIDTFYLHLEGPKGLPEVLGTGRNAVVFLATTTRDQDSAATDYRAIKFLRDDIDRQYAETAAIRFFEEAEKAQRFHRLQETFVKYYGWGAIGKPEGPDQNGKRRDFWWHDRLGGFVERLIDDDETNNRELDRLRLHYKLQGPFYVLDLCQGTLYDLLDKATPWHHLPAYSVSTYHDSLSSQSGRVGSDISRVTETYLTRPTNNRSGYEILNSFRTTPEANQLRNRAVLQIFSQVADAVAQLHRKRPEIAAPQPSDAPNQRAPRNANGGGRRRSEPLAHRDLKPGNIFFQHDASVDGLKYIKVQLSDLGYVTTASMINVGETLREGKKGAEYQAPGSQFYRAPEQAELPIEVRVDIDSAASDKVRVRGSKIDRIEIHDWLSLSDIFTDDQPDDLQNAGLFKILDVQYDAQESCYDLLLSRAIDSTRREDIQGQIIRSTGFHTDGFSLGSILYDMISGGKDPQQFYIYCIVSLIGLSRSVDEIVEILSPKPRPDGRPQDALNLAERRLMLPAVINAGDLDDLFGKLQEIALHRVDYRKRLELKLSERTRLATEAMRTSDIDDLVIGLIRSPLFTEDLNPPADGDLSNGTYVKLEERLRNYRFRTFHQVNELLRDQRGVPIPRDILRIIVACMVRNLDGSYYRRDPLLGYSSDINFAAATEIYKDVVALLSAQEYQLPASGFPDMLAENLLFKLRSLTYSSQPQTHHDPANMR